MERERLKEASQAKSKEEYEAKRTREAEEAKAKRKREKQEKKARKNKKKREEQKREKARLKRCAVRIKELPGTICATTAKYDYKPVTLMDVQL